MLNSHHLMGQYRRVSIVCSRSRVKVLDTGSLDSLLFVKGQLLQYPVVVKTYRCLFCTVPNFS